MMCLRVKQLLSDHLEGLLRKRQAEAVAAHLSDCPACRRFRNELLALGADLRAPTDLLPVPDVDRRAIEHWITERVTASTKPQRRPIGPFSLLRALDARWAHRMPSGAIAAVVLVLTVLVLILTRWQSGRSPGRHAPSIAKATPCERPAQADRFLTPLPPDARGRWIANLPLAPPRTRGGVTPPST